MSLLRRAKSTDARSWREAELVALDFESTSADAATAAPLSVGWVPIVDGRVRPGLGGYLLVDHPGEVPLASMRIHRLMPGELTDGVAPDELGDLLEPVLDGRVLVAHGAGLEQALLARLGVPYAATLDTLEIVRTLDSRAGHGRADPRLVAAARRYGVPTFTAHHAYRDALTTALLLVTLAGRREATGGSCLLDDLRRLGRT